MWSQADLLSPIARALRDAEASCRAEQAVRGLDALDETALHPLLADAWRADGLGAAREQPYPGDAEQRRRRAHRQRCDLVLTPDAHRPLRDPTAFLIASDKLKGGLFEHLAEQPAGLHAADTDPCWLPADAVWVEVKLAHQHAYRDGVPQPNTAYSREVLELPQADAVKLALDPEIEHAALLLLLFGEDEAVLRRDAMTAAGVWLDRDIPVNTPEFEHVSIDDRGGNAACVLMLTRLRL